MRRMAACAMMIVAGAPCRGAAPAWQGDAGNSQHTARAPAAAQAMSRIRWQTLVDLAPQGTGGELLIHYASPMITAGNIVLLPVKTTAAGDWQVRALTGKAGTMIWSLASDYIVPPDAAWVPAFPAQLTRQNRLYMAGAGGTVIARDAPNTKSGAVTRLAFYGLSVFDAHRAAMTNAVMIDTPITSDTAGNLYFGFVVEGANPAHLKSGLARLGADGRGSWVAASQMAGDATMTEVPVGSAPALSADGRSVYSAVSNGNAGYLVALDAATLTAKAHAALTDPASGQPAWITDLSSASPTVGPDGDVFYGVVENPYPNHDGRGWLLHFDAALTTAKTPGSFGWDDTVSIVPARALAKPARRTTGSYYVMAKYNNYANVGPYGDGRNKLAILDPHATQQDAFSSPPVTVMKEVETILGPTPDPDGPAGAVYEWCINSAVVDAASGAVFAGSEDGRLYRWDLPSNSFSQSLTLDPPLGEAYTPTLIGPDGTVYAINSATVYAVGR